MIAEPIDPPLSRADSLLVEEKKGMPAFDANVLKQIETEVRTIKAEYQGRVPEESIDQLAGESIERLSGSKVPQFVPLFVGRFTRERLRELVAMRVTSGK